MSWVLSRNLGPGRGGAAAAVVKAQVGPGRAAAAVDTEMKTRALTAGRAAVTPVCRLPGLQPTATKVLSRCPRYPHCLHNTQTALDNRQQTAGSRQQAAGSAIFIDTLCSRYLELNKERGLHNQRRYSDPSLLLLYFAAHCISWLADVDAAQRNPGRSCRTLQSWRQLERPAGRQSSCWQFSWLLCKL